MQPVEPNVPKQIVEGYTELGNWLAGEMRARGFKGITTNSTYDAWSPSRAYSHYHGGVRILSETASAKIATPITLKFEDLTSREGYDPKKESANFGPLWRGGEWHLRDITNHMTTVAFLLLRHAAEHRELWLQRFYEIGREAVKPTRKGDVVGFKLRITPAVSREADAAEALLQILSRAGVEFEMSVRSSVGIPPEIAVIKTAQPYGAFARALLEPQRYPDLRDAAGHPIAPYDVTAHALPLLMGANVTPLYKLPKSVKAPLEESRVPEKRSAPERIGLYQSLPPTMDEGWTRWLLQQEKQNFNSIAQSGVRRGTLNSEYDVVIIPDQAARTIINGYRSGTMPPELSGGVGQEGVKALRQYVENGGTLVFLNRASEFAIEQFKLPIKNVVAGLPRTEFYVPGSILRLELDTSHPIAQGMPKQSIAWAEESPVFEVIQNAAAAQYSVPSSAVKIIGWYPRTTDPLLSGWLLGGSRIKGKAALVEVQMGKGRIILFGFRPQYRAQSLATYPLFFNALRAGS